MSQPNQKRDSEPRKQKTRGETTWIDIVNNVVIFTGVIAIAYFTENNN